MDNKILFLSAKCNQFFKKCYRRQLTRGHMRIIHKHQFYVAEIVFVQCIKIG